MSKNENKLEKDIFVKNTKNVSFGSAVNLMEKFVSFAKEIEEYVLKNSKVDLLEVEKIVKKYSPTTKVKDFAQLPQNTNVNDRTFAYFRQNIKFGDDGCIVPDAKEIFVKVSQNMDKSQKLEFLEALEHEFTHILQEESSDRVSKISFIRKFIGNERLNQEKISTLSFMPKIFSSVEYYMSLPLYKFMAKSDNLPQPVKSATVDDLNRIYRQVTGYNAEDYIMLVREEIFKRLGNQGHIFDKKAIKEYAAMVAQKKHEAYENTTKMLNQKCGISGPSDLDLRVVLYDIFKKVMLR